MTQIEDGEAGERQRSDAHEAMSFVLSEYFPESTPADRRKVKFLRRSRRKWDFT
jgi:hypothetical protein